MQKYCCLLILALSTSAAVALAGQEEFAQQAGFTSTQAKAGTAEEAEPAAGELAELRRCLQKLQVEREALAKEQTEANQQLPGNVAPESPETAKLRARASELFSKFAAHAATKKANEQKSPPVAPSLSPSDFAKKREGNKKKDSAEPEGGKTEELESPDPATPLNPVALAHVLFKAGNYDQALKAYRMVSLVGMKVEERAPLQYLTAACLRKLGKTEDALVLFREVANVQGDEEIAACAQWQLVHLRWQAETAAQLKDLHDRRIALEGRQ